MRAKNIMGSAFLGGLVILWMGCGGVVESGGVVEKRWGVIEKRGRVVESRATPWHEVKCAHDTDCLGGFCNAGTCRDFSHRKYGGVCGARDPDSPPYLSLPEHICYDGYLCVDGRCRSCQSDAECESYYGTGKCMIVNGPTWQQGSACFPNTTRGLRGATCAKDDDCLSLFCDRGSCVGRTELSTWTYNLACTPGPLHGFTENHRDVPVGACDGYLCVDKRCRSCVSDEECQREGATDLKCLHLPDWPGKECVTPGVAEHPPARESSPFVTPPPTPPWGPVPPPHGG